MLEINIVWIYEPPRWTVGLDSALCTSGGTFVTRTGVTMQVTSTKRAKFSSVYEW